MDAYSRCEPLLSVAQLKARYMFGIDLTDKDGNVMPDDTIQYAIDSAISYLEHKLDIVILEKKFVEAHDYRAINYSNFNFMSLKKRPVIEVTLVKAQYGMGSDLLTYPPEWYVVEKDVGQLQLVPRAGASLAQISYLPGTISSSPLGFGSTASWPHLFEVSYSAGFCNGNVPAVINEMIGLKAAYNLFEILGDIILGLGVSSQSTSLDGASTSRTNSAGAGATVFSARMKSYNERLNDYIDTVRKYYNGIAFTVV